MKTIFTPFLFVLASLQITWACLPTADFSANYNSNGTFIITNNSIDADSILWDFGDGNTDTISTFVQHKYDDNGYYIVQLIAYNSCGTDTIVKEVFTRAIFYPCETQLNMPSLTVHFGPTISYADSVVWTFANGDMFVGENPPPFTFDSVGIYSYKVELYNFLDTFYVDRPSSINFISHNVEVNSPSINLDFDYEVLNSNVDVTFNSNYNYVETYEWDFGDGNFSSEENPTHTYPSEGNYTVQLAIKSYECGITDTIIKVIDIQCELPQANFQINQPDECDRTFQFNSTAINADSFYYSFGDGTGYYAENISHYYYSSGQYEVCQIAYNGCGADTICQIIDIGPTTSSPFFYSNQDDFTQPIFDFINLTDTATGYSWDFGDGNTSTETNPSHIFTQVGFYDVCLTAYAPCDTQTFCQPVFIDCIIPEPEFSYTQPLSNFWTINFTTNITDADSIVWIVNDSISYTGANPSHTFPNHGTYEVCQVVYACYGTDTLCQNIEVNCSEPVADFMYELDNEINFLFHFTDNSINGSSSIWMFDEDTIQSSSWNTSYIFDGLQQNYTITHIVTNSCTSDTITKTISICPPNNIVYINNKATGSNNGRNWENAFTNFKSAFEFINRCTINEVWVAEGIYFSDSSDASNHIEVTRSDLKIYGGFPNSGNPNFTDRNVEEFKTIISGNIGDTLSFLDNSKYFLGFTKTNSLIIDGLTFKEFVFGSSPLVVTNEHTFGSNLQINNCNFQKNIASYSAAINITKINKVQIQNTNFIDNIGTGHSRFNQIDSLEIESCLFTNNLENEDWGSEFNIFILAGYVDNIVIENSKFNNKGVSNFYSKRKVIELYSSLPTVNIKNCIVSNITTYAPSLVSLNTKNHIIENAVFYNNTANSVLLSYTPNTTFRNVIFNKNNMVNNRPISNNGVFENCLFDVDSCENVGVSSVCNSSSIFGTDAKFIDEQSENFKLKACSPAINAGTNTVSTVTDFEGNPRPYQSITDIGAYEWSGEQDELYMLDPSNVSSDIIQYADYSYNDGVWTHYYDCDSSQLLLSIAHEGNVYPSINNGLQVGIKLKTKYGTNDGQDISNADFHFAQSFFAMNRSWFVETTIQPQKPVKVRFYIHELKDLNDVARMYENNIGQNDIENISDLVFYKLHGTDNAYDQNISPSEANFYTYSNSSDLNHFSIGESNGIYYVEFEVSSFSAGSGGAMFNGNVLPVELLSFDVKNIDNSIALLNWSTASETNNKGFVIDRSKDAINFETIAWVDGHGNSNQIQHYTYKDEKIVQGNTYYYRLKQVDFDGTTTYSTVKTVTFEKNEEKVSIDIFPNPTSNYLNVSIDDSLPEKTRLTIYSLKGENIYQRILNEDKSTVSINVEGLPEGIYFIAINGTKINKSVKFQILK